MADLLPDGFIWTPFCPDLDQAIFEHRYTYKPYGMLCYAMLCYVQLPGAALAAGEVSRLR